MSENVYYISNDQDLEDKLAYDIANEEISQSLMYNYPVDGEDYYYDYIGELEKIDEVNSLQPNDYLSFGLRNSFIPNREIAFISLGCGNSGLEKYLYENLGPNYCVDYIGVDASRGMIDKSVNNMQDLGINKKFIWGDFGSHEFKSIIDNKIIGYDNRIFTFFGDTFGNIKHSNIIRVLYNMLNKGEQIWMSLALREEGTMDGDLHMFERYDNILKEENQRMKNLVFNVLERNGISLDDGDLGLEYERIEDINALKFKYIFRFKKKVDIIINNQTITCLPDKKISLLNIQRFDGDKLIAFIEANGFKFIDSQIKGLHGQFLFEKR